MDADRYAGDAPKAVFCDFSNFEAVEVRPSHFCENVLQSPPHTLRRECAEYCGLHFGSQEEAGPTGAANLLIQRGAGVRLKHAPSSRVRLAFQSQGTQDERPVLDEDSPNLDRGYHASQRLPYARLTFNADAPNLTGRRKRPLSGHAGSDFVET